MAAFSSIDIARTGVGFSSHWMDAIAHNMANINTVRPGDQAPFRARLVVAQQLGGQIAASGSGVRVGDILEEASDATVVSDPGNPLADAEGNVVMPVVDLAGQMTDLMIANRTYQANLKVISTSQEAYQAALRIGQR